MSTYTASNSFHVRDRDAFAQALDGLLISVATAAADSTSNHVYLRCEAAVGWPSERQDPDSGEPVALDLLALIAAHLAPGQVAELGQAAAHQTGHIAARASAVNRGGDTRTVDLDEIYERARALGGQIACDL